LRVAAISHSCVLPVNQQLFAELERQDDLELLLIAPASWRASLGGVTAFSRLPALQSPVAALPVRRSGHFALHSYVGLRETLADFRPDIIYADEEPHSLVARSAAIAARRLNTRFVFSTKQNLWRPFPWPISRIERQVHESAAGALAVTHAVGNTLRAKGYRGPLFIVPFAMDPALFVPRRSPETRASLDRGLPLVGYVGRLTEGKGLADLLAAAKAAWARGIAFTLVLIGAGPMRPAIEQALADVPPQRWQLVGPIAHDAVADYIGSLDLLVLPSRTGKTWKEQFGRVIIEALSCEVPVIGSNSGHIPHLIETTGGGFVFREGDSEDLALKLGEMLGDEGRRREMAVRGRAVVLERYTYARIAQATASAFRTICKA
jgi:L-malate glycosyltransferase